MNHWIVELQGVNMAHSHLSLNPTIQASNSFGRKRSWRREWSNKKDSYNHLALEGSSRKLIVLNAFRQKKAMQDF